MEANKGTLLESSPNGVAVAASSHEQALKHRMAIETALATATAVAQTANSNSA